MFPLLTIVGCVAALVILSIVVVQTKVQESLAGETTVVGLADPGAETIATGRFVAAPATRTDWQLATVGTLRDAEDLLDVLENRGIVERELLVLGNTCFTVRWR